MKVDSDALSITIPGDSKEKIIFEEIASRIIDRFVVLKIEENGKTISTRGLVSEHGFIVSDNKGKIKVYPLKTKIFGIIAMPN